MAMLMDLEVVSAEASMFNGRVEYVQIVGTEGELGILPFHAPLLTRLKAGIIRIVKQFGEEQQVYVSGGILEIHAKGVIVLADAAMHCDQHDMHDAEYIKQCALELKQRKRDQ